MPVVPVRFVCISDTHNETPSVPAGDVLIHAGNLTETGTLDELRKTVRWLESTEHQVKIVVGGPHDATLDSHFYAEHGGYFHHPAKEEQQACLDQILLSNQLTYLNHESRRIKFTNDRNRTVAFNIFGSPYTPGAEFGAFMIDAHQARDLWQSIPLNTDIVVTHVPAKYHLDESHRRGSIGCGVLRECLWRVRPKMAVSGHVPEAWGAQVTR